MSLVLGAASNLSVVELTADVNSTVEQLKELGKLIINFVLSSMYVLEYILRFINGRSSTIEFKNACPILFFQMPN